jgi:hypothetical protein
VTGATIYDVIDNFWGRDPLRKIGRADKVTINRFSKQVNRFYDSYAVTPPAPKQLRTYQGGLVAVDFSLAGSKQTTFFNNLLYAHSTIVPDPLARWYFERYEELQKTPAAEYCGGQASADQSEWIGWLLNSHRAFQWNLEASRDVLQFFVRGLLVIRSLVEHGIVVLVSQPHVLLDHSTEIVNRALADASDQEFCANLAAIDEQLPLWDNVRGGIMTPSVGGQIADPKIAGWATAKEAAYYTWKNLAISESAGGRYTPENDTDFDLLSRILMRVGRTADLQSLDLKIARAATQMRVPSLEGAAVRDIIAVREQEDSFEDFRLWLSSKLLNCSNSGGSELVVAELENETAKLRSRLSESAIIGEHLKRDGIRFIVTTLVGVASGSGIGRVLPGAVAGGLAGILSSLFERDRNASTVLAKIATMNRTAPDATFGKTGKPSGLPKALAQPFFGEMRVGPAESARSYTPSKLRQIVEQSLQPNRTDNPFRAIK